MFLEVIIDFPEHHLVLYNTVKSALSTDNIT